MNLKGDSAANSGHGPAGTGDGGPDFKDVLAGFFWMMTLLAYERYVRHPGARRYVPVCVLLILGLMAKSMLVTLPFVLLLLDVWPLGRWPSRSAGRLLLEKIPLFVVVGAISAVTVVAQKSAGAMGPMDVLPFGARIQNAVVSYGAYLWKTVWPTGLAFYYPHRSLQRRC